MALKSRQKFIQDLLGISALLAVPSVIGLLSASRPAFAQGDGGDGGVDGIPAGGGDGGDGGNAPTAPGLDAGTLALVGMGGSALFVKLKGLFKDAD